MPNGLSIKDISIKLDTEDEELLYGQFLDGFYNAETKETKYSLVEEEPFFRNENKVFMCILAGTVHKLSNDFGMDPPDWISDRKYALEKIYFAFETENPKFQEYLYQTTPIEYKSRNLIIGETLLERC